MLIGSFFINMLSKWFEARSISSLSNVIVLVSVVLKQKMLATVTDVATT